MEDIYKIKELVKDFRVLYAEDDLKLHNEVKTFLDKIFNNLDCVMNGEEAFELYQKNHYDVVITDIQMPKMNGIELVKKIKSINKEQIVIITSAHNEANYLIELINLGVTMFLLKPLRFMEIINIIGNIAKDFHDKRELKRLQFKEIRQNAMDEVLKNIAHHWRQPLNAISLLMQNLELDYAMGEIDKDSINKITENIVKQTQFLSNTINIFANVFRENSHTREFNIIRVIKEALTLMLPILNEKNIEVKFLILNDRVNKNLDLNDEYIDEEFNIESYYSEFLQVLINIIDNAKDAIFKLNGENGGFIQISIDKNMCEFYINIKDNGGGIKKDIIDQIFEPYFTTKEVGDGVGLNLYITKDIIENKLNGKVEVKNIEEGALFSIKLPAD